MCRTYGYANGGKVVVGIIALILAIAAISLDQLSYWPNATSDCSALLTNDPNAYGYCGFKEFRSHCFADLKYAYNSNDCKNLNGKDKCNKVYNDGTTFSSLTIIGCVAYGIGLLFSIPYEAFSYRSFVRFIYLVGAFCFAAGFATWAGGPCQKELSSVMDIDHYQYGYSSWLLLAGAVIGFFASAFEFFL